MSPETPAKRAPVRQRLEAILAAVKHHVTTRRLSWGAVVLGVVLGTVGLLPLATAVWDLLGLTSPPVLPTALVVAGSVIAATGLWGLTRHRTSPLPLALLIGAAWAVAAGVVALLTAGAWLLLGTPAWEPPDALAPRDLDAIATRAFAIVAGLGAVALLVINYRRQRTTERGEDREQTRSFNERFNAAYAELGSESAAVRLGAVHALAHLADDAPTDDQVQMVIDVLCAYLRMPYRMVPDEPPEGVDAEEYRQQRLEFESLREVRHTIIRVIGDHLRKPTRWRGRNYDFTGVVFDGGDLRGAKFVFGGVVRFSGAEFARGTVDLGAEFVGGVVYFADAKFTGGRVDFRGAEFTGGLVNFKGAEFTGGMVDFSGVKFAGAAIFFSMTKFTGGIVTFFDAKFIDGMVNFIGAKFADGKVFFVNAEFTGGKMDFFGAEFIGGIVEFSWAELTGGEVSFRELRHPGNAPIGLLEVIDAGEPGVVTDLPQEWRASTENGGTDPVDD